MTAIPSGQNIEKISIFAAENIATRYDLSNNEEFPYDLWEKMAQEGLFKIGIEKLYGGSGGGYLDMTEAAEVLVKNGYNMGIVTSWLYQQIVARFIIGGFGSKEQKSQFLPQMASGKLTASFAVSEPQRGAHPKYITTTASKDESVYVLNGEKTYLTNGPIAGLFIVIAVTEEAEQKKFTAFLVPRQKTGLKVGPPLNLNFLKPSPHGSIVLNNCRLPDTAILGKEGTAYREMVIAFGEIEDIVMMGAVAGAMAAQLSLLTSAAGKNNIANTELLQHRLGAQDVALQAIRTIIYSAAQSLDRGDVHTVSLAINFMDLTSEFQTNMDAIISKWNLQIDTRYSYLRSDLAAMMALKKKMTLLRQKKLGLGAC
jgi:alkylation response protein AidB-like acyl-CoA dehydrogenase